MTALHKVDLLVAVHRPLVFMKTMTSWEIISQWENRTIKNEVHLGHGQYYRFLVLMEDPSHHDEQTVLSKENSYLEL